MQLPWQTPGFAGNPYAVYHQFGRAPVRYDDRTWIVLGHADIVAVLKDANFGFSRTSEPANETALALTGQPGSGKLRQVMGTATHLMNLWLGARNPPHHTRLRAALAPAFSPGSIARLRARVQAATDALLDRVQDAGEMDVIADLADRLPMRVIGEMLGLPLADAARLRAWSAEATPMLDGGLRPIDTQRGLLATAAFADYLRPVMAQRQLEPRDDLISQLLESQAAGQLSTDELVAECIGIFFGGQETTSAMLGNVLLALLRHPEQLQRLRDEPDLIASAVEELLRYDSPAQFIARTALAEVELNGCALRQNQRVMLLLGAGNHDPAVFVEPDQLALDRSPNPHLVFGHGVHYCLGAHLARLEAQVVLSTLIQRLPRLALQAPPLEWRSSLRLRGLKALPVRF